MIFSWLVAVGATAIAIPHDLHVLREGRFRHPLGWGRIAVAVLLVQVADGREERVRILQAALVASQGVRGQGGLVLGLLLGPTGLLGLVGRLLGKPGQSMGREPPGLCRRVAGGAATGVTVAAKCGGPLAILYSVEVAH